MKTANGRAIPDLLLDTSAAVPLVSESHQFHSAVESAVAGSRLGLAGHAAFEAFSVLTRIPPPLRFEPAAARSVLSHNFPATRFLPEDAAADLLANLAGLGIAGGSVFDALVGATALHHGLRLATRNVRAQETYRKLGVDVLAIGS